MPVTTAVDYDPFAPVLTPVDHDPFADEMSPQQITQAAASLDPTAPTGRNPGAILPMSEDSQGDLRFDPNAGMLGDFRSGFTLPHDVYTGQTDLNSQEGFSRVQNLAMDMMGSGMPVAESGALGMAGGKVAPRDTVTLYHGTNNYGLKGIQTDGIVRGPVFVSPRAEMAAEYAGDNGHVLAISGPKSSLRVDADLPDGKLLTVKQANNYFGKNGWTIDDYLNSGKSVAFNKSIPYRKVTLTPVDHDPFSGEQ